MNDVVVQPDAPDLIYELLSNEQKLTLKRLNPNVKLLDEAQVAHLASRSLTKRQVAILMNVSEPTFIKHYSETWEKGRTGMFKQVMDLITEQAVDGGSLKALDIMRKELSDKAEPAQVNININTLPAAASNVSIDELNIIDV